MSLETVVTILTFIGAIAASAGISMILGATAPHALYIGLVLGSATAVWFHGLKVPPCA